MTPLKPADLDAISAALGEYIEHRKHVANCASCAAKLPPLIVEQIKRDYIAAEAAFDALELALIPFAMVGKNERR